MLELSVEIDRDLRGYAAWISPNDGEDAYHDAICDVLARGQAETINTPAAFYRCAIKRALYKIFRHERAERENTAAFLAGDPPPSAQALKLGRLPQTHCRRGHPLTEDNLTYVGPRRTCKVCFRARTAAAARSRRAAAKERGNHDQTQTDSGPVPALSGPPGDGLGWRAHECVGAGLVDAHH